MIEMDLVDHGSALPPLPSGARLVFMAARDLADDAGLISDRRALSLMVSLTDRQVRTWLAVLENARWQRRTLAKRDPTTWRLWVLCASIPGVPDRRKSTSVVDIEHPPLQRRFRRDRGRLRNDADTRWPGAVVDPDFRSLRAENGGLRRANKEFKKQIDESRSVIAKLESRIARGAVADVAQALANDLRHAADCGDPDCAMCLRIVDQLEEPDGPYVGVVGGG